MKNLILIDLDDTLFNTTKLKMMTHEFFKKYYQIEIDDFLADYDQIKVENNGMYSFVWHFKKHRPNVKYKRLKRDFLEHFSQHEFLYDYTEKVLNHLTSDKNNRIVIFSFGRVDSQELKLALYDILRIPELLVVDVKKKNFLEKNLKLENGIYKFLNFEESFEKVIYIDDNMDEGVESNGNFHAYKIEKGGLDINKLLELLAI